MLLLPPAALFLLRREEVAVRARVLQDRLVIDVQGLGGHVVQEAVVVGNDDDRPGELSDELLEPSDRQDVQVVRGLVEKQRVGRAGERLARAAPAA